MVITVLSSSVNYLVVGDWGKLFSVTYTHGKEQWPPAAAGKVGLATSAAVAAAARPGNRIFILGGFQDFG